MSSVADLLETTIKAGNHNLAIRICQKKVLRVESLTELLGKGGWNPLTPEFYTSLSQYSLAADSSVERAEITARKWTFGRSVAAHPGLFYSVLVQGEGEYDSHIE